MATALEPIPQYLTPSQVRDSLMTMSRKVVVSEQLRKAVEQAPVSRYAISKATGIDQAVLSKFVRGERKGISMETADALCDYLELTLVPKKPKKKEG
jgi:DNA-binding Xre family transcriptional regulator